MAGKSAMPLLVLAGGAALLLSGKKKKKRATTTATAGEGPSPYQPTEQEKTEPEMPPFVPSFGPAARKTRVPPKTTSPYNDTLLKNEFAVRGVLGGLSARYIVGAAGSKEQFAAATKKYQGDWNFLAAGDHMSPAHLNQSKLSTDSKAGYNTLRGLEWSKGMPWNQLLLQAGRV